MTDREKIRAEIERQYNEYMAKDSELAAIRADECLGILSHIDSMQEEPTTSVWHDASDIPVASKTKVVLYTNGKWDLFKAYEAKDDFDNYWAGVNQSLAEKGVFVKQWSYVDDLLKRDKVTKYSCSKPEAIPYTDFCDQCYSYNDHYQFKCSYLEKREYIKIKD